MDKRETTLRQLVYSVVKEATKEEGLIRSEIHELTEYILNNSVLEFTSDRLHLTEGNSMGIGESNKDKKITIPRFLTFNFNKKNIFQLLNSSSSRTWVLKTFQALEDIEGELIYNSNSKLVAVIDGEIVNYTVKYEKNWGYEVLWDCDVYIVTYVLDDKEEKEVLRSKKQLEERVLELVEKGATEIVAYDIVEGESLDFEVSKTVYTTRPERLSDNGDLGLMWLRENEGFFEEEDEDEELMF